MFERFYFKNVMNMTAREIMVLAQKIVDLGGSIKVSVTDGFMTVKNVNKYDERKVEFLEKEGFDSIEENDWD